MKYWHVVTDSNGLVKEQIKSISNNSKLSLECLSKVIKGDYKIIEQPCVK